MHPVPSAVQGLNVPPFPFLGVVGGRGRGRVLLERWGGGGEGGRGGRGPPLPLLKCSISTRNCKDVLH